MSDKIETLKKRIGALEAKLVSEQRKAVPARAEPFIESLPPPVRRLLVREFGEDLTPTRLAATRDSRLLGIRGFGRKALRAVRLELQDLGFKRPPEKWEEIALSMGWVPPEGWDEPR